MKKIISILLTLFCVLSLSACANLPQINTGNSIVDAMSPQQLGDALVRALDEREYLIEQAENSALEIERLKELVRGIQYTDPEFPAITRIDDTTDKVSFNKPGSYLRLPEGLAYPGVEVIPVDNKLQMGGANGITLVSASSWSYRLEGNRLYLANTVGVYGEIVLGRLNTEADIERIDILFDGHEGQQEIRDEWDRIIQAHIEQTKGVLNTVPPDPGKTAGKDEVIFWQNRAVGRQVSLNTLVNGESAVLRIGAFAVQNNAVLYAFAYDTERNDQCEALIMNMLLSVSVQDRNIAIGF